MDRWTFIQLTLGLTGMAGNGWQMLPRTTQIPRAWLLGQGNPEMHGHPTPLLPEVYAAFLKMKAKAVNAGIAIEVVSAYRSYDRQKAIWNRKFTANQKAGLSPEQNLKKIIEYSTLPGTSRHHWGTDFDIIDGNAPREGDVLLTKKFHNDGPYNKMRLWLEKNAEGFGFIRPYTAAKDRKGFYYEPWHYSYAPLAKTYLIEYLKLDLKESLTTETLLGKEHLTPAFLERYKTENILDINPKLL